MAGLLSANAAESRFRTGIAVALVALGHEGDVLEQLLLASNVEVACRLRAAAELGSLKADGGFGVVVFLSQGPKCVQAVRQVAEERPDLRTVVVAPSSDAGTVRRLVSAGVAGFVQLEDAETALQPTISAVAAGQLAIPLARSRDSTPETLTTREKQILALVVMGLRNGEIASKLFLAESTVKSHLSSAFGKLGVASRNEAAALILDPHAGFGTGILTIPTQKLRHGDA